MSLSLPNANRAFEKPILAEFLLIQTLFGLTGSAVAAADETALTSATVHWNGWVFAALLYVTIGPSIIAYRCWGLGVERGGPALAAFFGNLTPLFGALLSAAVLGETPHGYHVAAFALIVAGIAVGAAPGRGRPPQNVPG